MADLQHSDLFIGIKRMVPLVSKLGTTDITLLKNLVVLKLSYRFHRGKAVDTAKEKARRKRPCFRWHIKVGGA